MVWEFLKTSAIAGAGVVVGNALACSTAKRAAGGPAAKGAVGKKRPNIVLIITDQQRQAQHWPAGWLEGHMPTMARLQRHAITFSNNYTAAAACSPSRASLLTGVYPSVNGVPQIPPIPPTMGPA